MNSVDYLPELIQRKQCAAKGEIDLEFLSDVITSKNLERVTHELWNANALLSRTKMRLSNSTSLPKKTYGLESLVLNLSQLRENSKVELFNIKTDELIGSCMVFEDVILGYEFVQLGGSFSIRLS